jgi:hypothetical protein
LRLRNARDQRADALAMRSSARVFFGRASHRPCLASFTCALWPPRPALLNGHAVMGVLGTLVAECHPPKPGLLAPCIALPGNAVGHVLPRAMQCEGALRCAGAPPACVVHLGQCERGVVLAPPSRWLIALLGDNLVKRKAPRLSGAGPERLVQSPWCGSR